MHRLFLAAAAVFASTAAPIAPASCNEFVHTYLEGGLADGSTVSVDQSSAVLRLRYPPYPSVAGELQGGLLITLDNGQLNARLQTGSEDREANVLGCIGPDHLFATLGDELLGFSLGAPEAPAI